MGKKRSKGPCYRCGATISLSNCPADRINNPCPDCGQCECLRHYMEDYKPETDWTNA